MGCEGEIRGEQCMTRVGGNRLTALNYKVPFTLYVLCISRCTSSSKFIGVRNNTLWIPEVDFIMLQLMCSCRLFTALLPFGTGVVVRQSDWGIDWSGINHLCQWTQSPTTNWREIKLALFTMAALSTCINGFKCMLKLPGSCYFT